MLELLAPRDFKKKLEKFAPVFYKKIEEEIYLRFWDVIVIKDPQSAYLAAKFSKFGTLTVNVGEQRLKEVLNLHVDDLILTLDLMNKIVQERKKRNVVGKVEKLLMEPIMLNTKMERAYKILSQNSLSRTSVVIAEDGLLEDWILCPLIENHEVMDFGILSEEEGLLRMFGTKNHLPLLSNKRVLVLMNCDNCSEHTISKIARSSSQGQFSPYFSEKTEQCVARTMFHFENEKNIPELLKQFAGTSQVRIPPIREVHESLPKIFRFFLSIMGQNMSMVNMKISQDVINRIRRSKWNENWREFMSFCKSFASGEDKMEHRLSNVKNMPNLKEYTKMVLAEAERDLIKQAIHIYGLERKKLCEILKINPKTLTKKLKLYGLDERD